MQKNSGVDFPKRFLWGASVSSHQVEGGNHNQWTVWELENAKTLAAKAPYSYDDVDKWNEIKPLATDPNNYISGKAVDHYRLFKQDFEIARRMHMNAWRFSVEWSRVEPQEGAWNIEAIEYYKTYVKTLADMGMEPVVTLFHFTLPVWFAQMGGFEKRKNVKYFVRFAEKIVKELGISVKYIITLNEPEIYAYESYYAGVWPPQQTSFRQLRRVVINLAHAHNDAADAIHALNRRYKVSIAKNSVHLHAGDDARLSIWSAQVMQYLRDDYLMRKIIKKCDFIGLNYYFSDRVYGYRIHNANEHQNDMGWNMEPENIQHVLERLSEKYNKPILITENGLADADDEQRKWWLTQSLLAMQKAMSHGVELLGYIHWSLLDNFEWDKGFWPKFGMVAVDRTTMKRTPRPSAVWFAKVLAKLQKDAS